MKPRKLHFILTASSALLLAPVAFAQNGTWNVTTTPASWATPGNWVGNVVAGGSGSTANFNTLNIPADTTVNLDGARTIGNLLFGDTDTSTAGSWILATGSGGPLTLEGATPTITVNTLGTITGPPLVAKNVTITATLGGTSGFTKDGAGVLVLNNTTNTISGAVVLSGGTLNIQSKPLTNVTSVAINAGTLVIATNTANALGGTISLGGGLLQYNVSSTGSDYSAQFSTTASQQYRISPIASQVVTFSSNLASAGGTLTKTGAGTLILAAANTFSGATTVSAGNLELSNAGALQNSAINTTTSIVGTNAAGLVLSTGVTSPTFGGLTGDKALASLFDTNSGNYSSVTNLTLNPGSSASYSYSGAIANGAANMKLIKTGNGTQILTGPNTYTGDTMVSAGILTLGANDVISDSSVVKLDGGTLNTANGVVETLHSIQATAGKLLLGVSGTAGSADITLLNDSVIHNIEVGINGTLRLAAGRTLTQTATGATSQLVTGDTFTLDTGAGGFAHLSGAINSGGNDGAVTKTGSGTLRLTGATSQWGGNTVIENGTLEFNTIANYDIASSLGDGDNGGTNDAILRIGSTATAATLKMIGTEVKNSSNRSIQLGNAGGSIDVDDAAQALTLSGVVSNATTSGALTKAGAGTLVLSNTNTYEGASTVSAGILQLDGSTHANSAVSIGTNGTLAGRGTVHGTLAVSGKLAPGDAGVVDIEALTAGTTTWNDGSIWNFDLSSSGTTSDKLDITGNLTKGGAGAYQFDFMGSTPAWNTTYTLVDWSGTTDFVLGDFSFTNLGAGPYGASSFGFNGSSLTFTAVPEPTTALAGLLLSAGLMRRRR